MQTLANDDFLPKSLPSPDEIMGVRVKQCRLWWPSSLSSTLQPHAQSSTFFFGWFIFSDSHSEPSFDIVVASALQVSALSSSNLQDILEQANGNMSVSLQDKCKFSLLGYYTDDLSCNGLLHAARSEMGKFMDSTDQGTCFHNGLSSVESQIKRVSCGCDEIDGSPKQFKLASAQNEPFFRLVYAHCETGSREFQLIPTLHHLHWNGEIFSQLDLHVINYEIPKFSGHHYTLGSQSLYAKMRSSTKKPLWFENLNQKQPRLDLDVVILAINSSNAAKIILERHLLVKRSMLSFKFFGRFSALSWKLIALLLASLTCIVYMIILSFRLFLSYVSSLGIHIILANLFKNTCASIEVRCCQFLYWPIFLRNHGFRSQSCVEYAEIEASCRHSVWSCIAVDVLLGNLFGIVLWYQAEPACLCIENFSGDFTNYLLRDGCVWLMGNPAGFKLNTELARVLGMVSLNSIQIWSTLWSLMGFLFVPIAKVVAISGSLLGFTTMAALIIDLLLLATRHMFILHWLLSIIYSQQILALASLWRLFRGKKWNPLRLRLDSYDYTVEQHIVGSLLFTPLLLLLPTTSVFYTFFAIMNTVVIIICVVIQVCISVIHATPYNRVFLWFMRKRRFPAGIWFKIVSSRPSISSSLMVKPVDSLGSSSRKSQKIPNSSDAKHAILVTVLHSNYLTLRELLCSSYRDIYAAVSRSAIGSLAYGVLTGTRIPSVLGTVFPSRLPWLGVPCREYWLLCYEAVLSCREN